MYSNMCVKVALCLALIVSIDGYVLKHHQVPLSPEGMTVEITVRNKGDRHPLSTMNIDIDEKDKKLVISEGETPLGVYEHLGKLPALPTPAPKNLGHVHPVPTLENRHGIRVGACPQGTVGRGGFCFPSDDA